MQVYWKGSVRKRNTEIQVNCAQSCNLLSGMCAKYYHYSFTLFVCLNCRAKISLVYMYKYIERFNVLKKKYIISIKQCLMLYNKESTI